MATEQKQFKHLDTVTALFVAVLLISNIVTSKIIGFGNFAFPGAVIIFPLSYIFGDILTEVYGYKRARKVIWLGFLSNILLAVILMIVGSLPAAPGWQNQDAYEKILGLTPRIVVASLIAYFAGEFVNSFILAKMKLATKGKWLFSRTIGSTVIGEFIDTALFILIAFWGVLPQQLIVTIVASNYIAKTLIEIIFTPITYVVVDWLKKQEKEDYYDKKTNFNPFTM
jgi:queuosine precursor transporter